MNCSEENKDCKLIKRRTERHTSTLARAVRANPEGIMVALTAVCNASLLLGSLSLTKEARQCNIKDQICKSKKWFESWKKVQRDGIVWVRG